MSDQKLHGALLGRSWLTALMCLGVSLLGVSRGRAQASSGVGQDKGGQLSFDVASVREDKSAGAASAEEPGSNVPLGPGDVYSPTGGLFMARDMTLVSFIAFAYRMTDGQLSTFKSMAPDWVERDRFTIQARTEKLDVTKDELRLMMRSLLKERFGFAVHYETRQTSVYDLTLVKPGEMGPKLHVHPAQVACPSLLPGKAAESGPAPPETVAGGYPYTCGAIVLLPATAANLIHIGGRNISLALLANSLTSWGQLNRPFVDRTGLSGKIDFALEYVPERAPSLVESASADADLGGPDFRQALKQQLGLRLQAEKGETQVVVLDHIGRLSPN